jgi:hypothetical protein
MPKCLTDSVYMRAVGVCLLCDHALRFHPQWVDAIFKPVLLVPLLHALDAPQFRELLLKVTQALLDAGVRLRGVAQQRLGQPARVQVRRAIGLDVELARTILRALSLLPPPMALLLWGCACRRVGGVPRAEDLAEIVGIAQLGAAVAEPVAVALPAWWLSSVRCSIASDFTGSATRTHPEAPCQAQCSSQPRGGRCASVAELLPDAGGMRAVIVRETHQPSSGSTHASCAACVHRNVGVAN